MPLALPRAGVGGKGPCRGWAQHIVDRWRDAVSLGSPPFASDDLDLLPCDISLDFPFRGAYRGLNVPGA